MNAPHPSLAIHTLLRNLPIHGEPRLLCPSGMNGGRPVLPQRDVDSDIQENSDTVSTDLGQSTDWSHKGYLEGFKKGTTEGWEKGRLEGLDQGMQEGREQGKREGLRLSQDARSSLHERISQMDQLLQALPEQLQIQIAARIEAAEEDMIAICHAVVCRLLGEKGFRRERIVNGVRQALKQCFKTGSQGSLSGLIAIHVHPRDLEFLESDPELSRWLTQLRNSPIPWIADDQVGLGGCIVRTSQGSLDARLETQFLSLRRLILDACQSPSAGTSQAPAAGEWQ